MNYVVSLTSTAARSSSVRRVVESLLAMQPAPSRVYVWAVSVRTAEALRGADERVVVTRVPDEGPSTKVLPLLRDERVDDDEHVMIVDDDQLAHPRRAERYARVVAAHPEACVLWRGILRGCDGYVVRKRYLKPLLEDFERVSPRLRFIDDDMITHALLSRGVEFYRVAARGEGLMQRALEYRGLRHKPKHRASLRAELQRHVQRTTGKFFNLTEDGRQVRTLRVWNGVPRLHVEEAPSSARGPEERLELLRALRSRR
jgi:hypothetical protein